MGKQESDNMMGGFNILDPKQLLLYAKDTSKEGRYRLASAFSDFFNEETLTDHEKDLAHEIMMGLVQRAAIDLREALAERISLQSNIPVEIVKYLATDEISVARPILLHSPVLTDIMLIDIITLKGEDYWRSIANRKTLSESVIYRLADTGDSETVLSLSNNKNIVLKEDCIRKMIRISLECEKIQASLVHRSEINADLAIDLYMCASHAIKRDLSEKFIISSSAIEAALENLVAEMSLEMKGQQKVTSELLALAARFNERDQISSDLMLKTLRRGQKSFFLALFSKKIGLSPESVVVLLEKDAGKPFALACRSLRLMKSEFASLFLLSRSIHSSDRIVDQKELAAALKYYDNLKDFNVERAIRMWRKDPDMIYTPSL